MNISGKMILNSAEGILRERKGASNTRHKADISVNKEGTLRKTEGVKQDLLQVRLLNLQASMNRIQSEYSREQSRYSYLKNHPGEIQEKLQFSGKALFPELGAGKIDFDSLKKSVSNRLQDLGRNLKSVQVEMENLFALNFNTLPIPGIDAEKLLQAPALRAIDPSRVAKLTRD